VEIVRKGGLVNFFSGCPAARAFNSTPPASTIRASAHREFSSHAAHGRRALEFIEAGVIVPTISWMASVRWLVPSLFRRCRRETEP
jgi:hypothetical protein